ncbi:MAG TPA: glutaredoxin domain-containing protein [Byssovorax sp.]|jgi:glutaredoxin-related protein
MSTQASTGAARPLLDSSNVTPKALDKMTSFHAEVVRDVAKAVADEKVVVVGMAQNPHVKNVRKALEAAGVEFRYLEYGSYFSQWKERLAVKMWSGWPTFPQVFVRGTLVGGEDATKAALDDGSLKRMMQG